MSDQSHPTKIITVFESSSPGEAEVIKIMLANHGIHCELDGETQGGFVGVMNIGILVEAKDAEEARRLIREHIEHAQDDES